MSSTKKRQGRPAGKKTMNRLRELCDELNDRDEEIKKNEQMFRIILEDSPVSILTWTVDKELRFTKSIGSDRDFELLDVREPSQLRGKSLYDFFNTDSNDLPPIKHHIAALGGETRTYTFEHMNQVFWTKCKPIYNDDNDIVGVSGVAWNFTTIQNAASLLDDMHALMNVKPLKKMILYEKIQKLSHMLSGMMPVSGGDNQ